MPKDQMDLFGHGPAKVSEAEQQDRIVEEEIERDEALEKLEEHRGELVAEAFKLAHAIMHGTVTSTIVFQLMRQFPELAEKLDDVDPRFMGVVFRKKGWEEVGMIKSGSHGRRVPIWKWTGPLPIKNDSVTLPKGAEQSKSTD
jgi:hypothetical protein